MHALVRFLARGAHLALGRPQRATERSRRAVMSAAARVNSATSNWRGHSALHEGCVVSPHTSASINMVLYGSELFEEQPAFMRLKDENHGIRWSSRLSR